VEVNCLQQGFWFEAGRVLFAVAVVTMVVVAWACIYAFLYWRSGK
jgi:hypothetical protein